MIFLEILGTALKKNTENTRPIAIGTQ